MEADGYLLSELRKEQFDVIAPDREWVATVVKEGEGVYSAGPCRPGWKMAEAAFASLEEGFLAVIKMHREGQAIADALPADDPGVRLYIVTHPTQDPIIEYENGVAIPWHVFRASGS